jgi:hypothetical protein
MSEKTRFYVRVCCSLLIGAGCFTVGRLAGPVMHGWRAGVAAVVLLVMLGLAALWGWLLK